VQLLTAIFIKYCAKCKSVIEKYTTKLFQFNFILFDCMKKSYVTDYLRLNVIYGETVVCKLDVLQPQSSTTPFLPR